MFTCAVYIYVCISVMETLVYRIESSEVLHKGENDIIAHRTYYAVPPENTPPPTTLDYSSTYTQQYSYTTAVVLNSSSLYSMARTSAVMHCIIHLPSATCVVQTHIRTT